MSGLRTPTALFLLLTLLPAAILAWQGWRATEPLIAELQRSARDVAGRKAAEVAAMLPGAIAEAQAHTSRRLTWIAADLRERLPAEGVAAFARLPVIGAPTLRAGGRALLPAGPDRLHLQHLPEWTRFTAWRSRVEREPATEELVAQAHAFVAPSLRALALAAVLRGQPERAAAALGEIDRPALAAAGPSPCQVLSQSGPGRALLAEGHVVGWLYAVSATEEARAAWLAAAAGDGFIRVIEDQGIQDIRARREAGAPVFVTSVPVVPGVDLELARNPVTLLYPLRLGAEDAVCTVELEPAPAATPLHWTGPATAAVSVDTAVGAIAVTATHRGHPALEQQAQRQRWLTGVGLALLLLLLTTGLALVRRTLLREQRARALRDDFIANVSHELKTPLTSLRLHADMLAGDALAPDERRRYGKVALAEGARLSALVDDLLDFAALERGRRRLEPEPVDLAAAVRATADTWRPLVEREGVALAVTANGEALALADPTALTRILSNLVQNAFRHGRPARDGGASRITLAAGAQCIEVRDNGPGIAAADRPRIFERFARASRGKEGVGLGLALSRELARAQGGDLQCDDDGGETVFRLQLPAAPAMETA